MTTAGDAGRSPGRIPSRCRTGRPPAARTLPASPTADEFEAEYALRSGTTVERLRALGRVVKACRCGADGCQGWQSISADNAALAEQLYEQGAGPRPDWIDA